MGRRRAPAAFALRRAVVFAAIALGAGRRIDLDPGRGGSRGSASPVGGLGEPASAPVAVTRPSRRGDSTAVRLDRPAGTKGGEEAGGGAFIRRRLGRLGAAVNEDVREERAEDPQGVGVLGAEDAEDAEDALEVEEGIESGEDDEADGGGAGGRTDEVEGGEVEAESPAREEARTREAVRKKSGKKSRVVKKGASKEGIEDQAEDSSSADAAIAEADAAIAKMKADTAALDAQFPELVGFSDDDSLRRKEEESAESEAAFQERAEQEQLTAMREELRAAKASHAAERGPRRGESSVGDDTDVSPADASTKASSATSSLIDLLTRHAPPPPPEELAAGGFPQIVFGATSKVPEEAKRRDGWELAWSDEFEGDGLDPTKWTPRANASAPGLEYAGGQQQWYSPEECKVVGGALILRTRRRPGDFFLVPGAKRSSASEYPFVSCWVDTERHFTQTYGRVEIRAKLPDHACPGVWPQHWMLPHPETSVPKRACWPLGGEIDIMASYARGRGGPGARAGTVESGYHFAPKGECGVDGSARQTFPSEMGAKMDFHSDFHVFAVEWDKASLTYFVDGVPTMELTSFHVPIIPRWPFYLILNTAVSPFGLPEALDCDYDLYHYVDYVRVYRREVREVDNRVWWFLYLAVGGLTMALALAACVVMRQVRADEEEESERSAHLGEAREKVVRDGRLDRDAWGDDAFGYRKGGPRRENLRLFDTGGGKVAGGVGRGRGGFKGKNSVESAPLIGGIGLRLPDDGRGGKARGAATGSAASGQLRSRARVGSALSNAFGFNEKPSVFERRLSEDGGLVEGGVEDVNAFGRPSRLFSGDRESGPRAPGDLRGTRYLGGL